MTNQVLTIAQLARSLGAEFIGDGSHEISRVASIEHAQGGEITFLSNPKYKQELNTTQAGCVLLSAESKAFASTNVIVVENPYLGFAKVAQMLDTTPIPQAGIHPRAIIGERVEIGDNVSLAAGCVIEDDVCLAANVSVGSNTVIGLGSSIGAGTRIFANVSIYHHVQIGDNCIFQSGCVIGADGFGYANEKGVWIRIPQTGTVIIGNDVDVGANACIDRGALNNTVIGNGVKIDNLCHIAHNVEIGEHTAMAGFTGIAGSAVIGKHCTFSGRSSILGHLSIADGTHVTACSLINRSNKEAGVFSSGTGMQDNKTWRKNVARFRQLDDMAKQLKKLEKDLILLKGDTQQ